MKNLGTKDVFSFLDELVFSYLFFQCLLFVRGKSRGGSLRDLQVDYPYGRDDRTRHVCGF